MDPPSRPTVSPQFVSIAFGILLVGSALAGATGPAMATQGTDTETGNATGTAAPDGPPPATQGDAAQIVLVAPNPARDGDAGEFVAVRLPEVGNWSVSDGETTATLSNQSGLVVLTSDPEVVRGDIDAERSKTSHSNATIVAAPFNLANGGERLTLRRAGSVVHRVTYDAAPDGERFLPATNEWRPVGLSVREAVATGPANATTFVLPDSPAVPVETVAAAEERILLAGYTFASSQVADELVAAVQRGVEVRVLVEAGPVGGISRQQGSTLDRLVDNGVEVRVVGVHPERFAFHHPKYAVVDDRALVMTENWKPAGTGGRSSRGWGVRVDSNATAAELRSVFEHDARGPDTRLWAEFRRGRRFERHTAANGTYPGAFDAKTVFAENITLLTAPGNAESAIVERIDGAERRVDVIQPTLGTRENALVRATLRAARRGVDVRLLLSGGWYVAEENRALVAWLNDWADRTDSPLTAKVAEPKDRYEKIHAKGVLVDDDVAIVGSLNWNRNSARENREVALALSGPEPVAYYREVFAADWSGGTERRRGWLFGAGAVAAVVLAIGVAVRTVSFASVLEE